MDNNPASVNFGKPITEVCTATSCTPVGNPYGPIGAPTPNSPPIQFSLRARYEWTVAEYNPFIQFGANHVGHSFSQSGEVATSLQAAPTGKTPYEIPAYSTFDASMGIAKGAWTVTAYGQNLGNSNASTFISGAQYIVAQTPLRPRVLGMSFGYKF
jgi:outer membrane receptor protein involved in Fe transport